MWHMWLRTPLCIFGRELNEWMAGQPPLAPLASVTVTTGWLPLATLAHWDSGLGTLHAW